MRREKEIHEKAVRLIEGGIVEVDGHSVKMKRSYDKFTPCSDCEMDCLCHSGKDISDLCLECDWITGDICFLVLMDNK